MIDLFDEMFPDRSRWDAEDIEDDEVEDELDPILFDDEEE